ncbi:MAG: AMP-binding protein, partial [Rhodospirillaceae bacterium]|nr:AMP-binding protein [Rhodospirillaceae bacterium]
GGAPVAPWLAQAAWEAGIPVHEGYGLSECTSVVALNRFGERVAGTVGRPLDGIDVTISETGEIIVSGPSIMDGYLGGKNASASLLTGDLGAITPAGHLVVHGRCDNVLVTAFGRNVSPEWIEPMLIADPRIEQAVVLLDSELKLTALLGLNDEGMAWAARMAPDELTQHVVALCRDAPAYARPERVAIRPVNDLLTSGVVGPGGHIDRRCAVDCLPDIDARCVTNPMDETRNMESETV